jgi:hypothetical protein
VIEASEIREKSMPGSKRQIAGSTSTAAGMVPIDRRRFLKGTTAALAIAAREGVARGYAATAPYKVDVQIR